jgi:hypothetical protein
MMALAMVIAAKSGSARIERPVAGYAEAIE